MAIDALGTLGVGFVKVVRHRIVLGQRVLVARSTNLISIVLQPRGVRIVTVAAANALVIHFALNERTMFVVLIQNLTIGIIDAFGQQLTGIMVIKIVSRLEASGDYVAATVARSAGLDLIFSGQLQIRQSE